MTTGYDVLQALDKITGGRCVKDLGDIFSGKNRFVVIKSSNIPGKSCMETPGLVCGKLESPVKKIAVTMTLTECNIELAGATGVHRHRDVADRSGVAHRRRLGAVRSA